MISLTFPDLDDPLDLVVATSLLCYGLMSLVSNRWPMIPMLTRSGGLLTYGKFASGVTFGVSVPSKLGMALLYFPSMCLGIGFYFYFQGGLACLLSTIHFAKRVAESLFLHRYSGTMPLATSLFVSVGYMGMTFCFYFYGTKGDDLAVENISSTHAAFVGVTLFVIGTSGNLYHHYILATLRSPSDKTYKVPQGAFFEYVTAPHYLFELIGWFGMAIAAQHFLTTFIAFDMLIYLADRAEGQTNWYLSHKYLKDKYPKSRKHLIPFIF
jgi:hypothetical protein